jgi:hypothetical protein
MVTSRYVEIITFRKSKQFIGDNLYELWARVIKPRGL